MNGPFTLQRYGSGFDVMAADGMPIASITGILIDGSGRKERYPDGIIRTREQRAAEAKFVIEALNAAWANGARIVT